MQLLCKLTAPNAQLPAQSHPSDAGFDLVSTVTLNIKPGETKMVDTNVNIAIKRDSVEEFYGEDWLDSLDDRQREKIVADFVQAEKCYNYVGFVCSRSGLAAKNSVFVLNAPGVVDEGYRGEVKVILHNAGSRDFAVTPGMRIAQIVFMRVDIPSKVTQVEELPPADRNEAGFGSTGTH